MVAQFDVDMLIWVGQSAVAGGLLYELTAVGKDERLRGIADDGYAVDEVGEDDRLARAGGQ